MTGEATACPACSASLRAGARFCDRCGAATTGAASGDGWVRAESSSRPPNGPELGVPERRQTTVLFCDLVESTRLSVQLDPEDLRDVLHSFREVARAVVARQEGFIASYLGDGVLVLFAYPRAHEDDPQRAVRAALELVAAVPRIVTRNKELLRVRVGIATGITVIGPLVASGTSFDEIVVGQTTNLAARLQSVAGPNAIVISDATKRLVDDDFECQSLGAYALKGFDAPVQCWQVVQERGEPDSVRSKQRHRMLPLVGREHELDVLRECWRQACESRGNLVLIQGEPGVGKSRLVVTLRELVAQSPHALRRYTCAPRFQNTALFPVIHEIERAAAFAPDDSWAQKLDKLEVFVASDDRYEDVSGVSAMLASLLSVPFEGRYPPLGDSAEKQRARTFKALKTALFALARPVPALLIIEDIHWADPTTLELLREILAEVTTRRILVVATVRSGFGDVCPPCEATVTLELPRMGLEQSRQMILQLAAGKPLRPEVVDHIAHKSEGVPLFTEELTKMALEYGSPEDQSDITKSLIPSTLQDSLAARLDRLAPAKELVRAASAIGREFSYDLLAEVLGGSEVELRASLRSLIFADIVHLQDEALQSYSFKHALLQEAAYAMMVRSARQPLHRRIADVLEGRSPESRATTPEVLAHHFSEAGEPLLAVPYLEQAAQHASARAAHTEAYRQLRRGLELLTQASPGSRRDELELRLSVALGLAASATQGYAAPEVEGAYQRSLELSRSLGKTAELFPALRGLCTFYIVRGALATARDVGQECLRLAEASGSPADLIESATAVGYALVYQGFLSEGQAQLERAVALYRKHDGEKLSYPSLQDPAVASLALQAIAAWMSGEVRRAQQLQAEALALAERLGQPFNLAYAHSFAALLANIRSRFADAARHAAVARQVADEHGFTVWYGAATIHQSIALGNSGEAASAIPVLSHMLGLWQAGGAELSRPLFLWGLARCNVSAGDIPAALRALDEALETSKRTGEGLLLPDILRLRGELLHAQEPANVELWQSQLSVAVSSARLQGARLLELRALTTLLARASGEQASDDRERLLELTRELREAGESDSELDVAEAVLRAAAS